MNNIVNKTLPLEKNSRCISRYFRGTCIHHLCSKYWLSSTGGRGHPPQAVCPPGDFCPLLKFGLKTIAQLKKFAKQ